MSASINLIVENHELTGFVRIVLENGTDNKVTPSDVYHVSYIVVYTMALCLAFHQNVCLAENRLEIQVKWMNCVVRIEKKILQKQNGISTQKNATKSKLNWISSGDTGYVFICLKRDITRHISYILCQLVQYFAY